VSTTTGASVPVQVLARYPRFAEVGKTYLLTLDLQPDRAVAWPFKGEEHIIHCLLDAHPLFVARPLEGGAVLMHRFGGSYGPARFLLTAQRSGQMRIIVTLANHWEVPFYSFALDPVRVTEAGEPLPPAVEALVAIERNLLQRLRPQSRPPERIAVDEGHDILGTLSSGRPRLMATRTAIARTQALLRRSSTALQWQRQITNQADVILGQPTLTQDWVHDPRETAAAPLPLVRPPKSTDGPAAPLDIARLFCLRIQTLGITWFLTGDSRYCDRAKAELLAVCAFSDWADDKFLTTAETAFGAAIGYDWLYDILTDSERRQIACAIADKAIQPGLYQFAKPSPPYWTKTAMNWNLVCNGGLMIAALSVLESDQRAAQLFSMCRKSVPIGFSAYAPDGGWAEGPGYWHYATQYAIYLLDSLSTSLDTDLGLDASPGFSKTGLFRLHTAGPSGKLFNFADSEERHSGGYWLFWLARRYHQPVDAGIERHVEKVHPMDLLWFEENAPGPSRLATAGRFCAAGIVTLRGSWQDPDTTYLGIKAGANGTCEHGHYDLGSFVLDSAGVRWATDLGPDDYNLPDYFRPDMRVVYYRTSTIGHNTIVIDGECQPPNARAVITRKNLVGKTPFVVIDLSAAYPNAIRASRGFALIDGRDVLIVDEIVPKISLSTVDWQMHTQAHVGLENVIASLLYPTQGDRIEAPHFYLRIIDPDTAEWTLKSAAPSEPRGQNPNTGFSKLVIRLERVAQPVRFAVLLSPDTNTRATTPELPLALRRPLSDWAVEADSANEASRSGLLR
jgi:hypothetical protein